MPHHLISEFICTFLTSLPHVERPVTNVDRGTGNSGEKGTGVTSPSHQEDGGVGHGAVLQHVEFPDVKNADALMEDQRAGEGEEVLTLCKRWKVLIVGTRKLTNKKQNIQGPVASDREQDPTHGEEQGIGNLPSQTMPPPGLPPIPQNIIGGTGERPTYFPIWCHIRLGTHR